MNREELIKVALRAESNLATLLADYMTLIGDDRRKIAGALEVLRKLAKEG